MNFALSPEQQLLKDSVARFAAERGDSSDPWPTFAELGWLAIGTPEDLGGFGGPIETLLVQEQFGRGLVTSPYVAQVVLAGAMVRAAGRTDLLEAIIDGTRRIAVAYEERGARSDPAAVTTAATRQGDGYILNGEKFRVLGASAADALIVSARDGDVVTLFLVPTAALAHEQYDAEDGHDVATCRISDVRVARGDIVGAPGDGVALLELALDHAVAATCGEMLGLSALLLEATVDYTKQRHQFGAPIGSFQALQHRMAEMFVELELARSAATMAAMTLADNDRDATRRRTVSGAKVQVAKSARFIAQNAIQLHGGIGMSAEYRVGRYFKRITALERLFGDTSYHLARFRSCSPSATPRATSSGVLP